MQELGVEAAHDFAGKLDMGNLVLADRNEQVQLRFAIENDIRGLQERVAEEAVGAEVAVFEILDLFFVRRHAFEPAERRDHGKGARSAARRGIRECWTE